MRGPSQVRGNGRALTNQEWVHDKESNRHENGNLQRRETFLRRGAGESGGVSKADNPTSDASVYLGKFTKNRTIMVGMQNTISKIPRAPYPYTMRM